VSWAAVIPSASAANSVRSVGSIFASHPAGGRVVIVDDGARCDAEERLRDDVLWVAGVKPFVYARNVNIGVAAAPPVDTLIVMGDDVEVQTIGAFDVADRFLRDNPQVGVLSVAIEGVVGNPRQWHGGESGYRAEPDWLAFVCVAIPRHVFTLVGPLDERFTGYGCEDVDYCRRVREAGFEIGVLHDCVVRHDGTLPSTYRTRPDISRLSENNREILWRKWNASSTSSS
jgi:hypothetical protein